MTVAQYKSSIPKKLAIQGFNLLPLAWARNIIDFLFGTGLRRSAGFFAKHYSIDGMDVLPVGETDARFVNDGAIISQLIYFLGTKGYEDYEIGI